MSSIADWGQRFYAMIWQPRLERVGTARRSLLVAVRIAATLISDFRTGELTMRAMGLVYTTLVSLVPLLALAFSLLKAFGADNALRPVLQRFLSPLGQGSGQIVDKIVDFVQNVQVGVLGAIGVVALIYSVISLIQKVEAGCNYIWQVRNARSLGRRITEYLSVLIAGPLVVLAAASLTAAASSNSVVAYISSIEPFGAFIHTLGRILPFVLYSVAFALLFKFMPNTWVRILPAVGGGIFAGVLWQSASLGFTLFAKNAGNVNAIYSSFAILILLLIWLYVSWMILLFGCRVAFLLQHTERLTPGPYPPHLGAAERERLALLMSTLIAARFIEGRTPWTVEELAHALRASTVHVHEIGDQLVAGDLLVEAGEHRVVLLPRRDIAEVRIDNVVDIVRTGDTRARAAPRDSRAAETIDRLEQDVATARRRVYGERSLRDLALSVNERADTSPSAT